MPSKEERGKLAGWQRCAARSPSPTPRRAYQIYKEIFAGPRWEKLAARGARPQRLLWASTGTKNKAYSDVLYVDTLIGPDTVNTMPPETMDAFRDHGTAKSTIEDGVEDAHTVLKTLAEGGIDLDKVTADLVENGVDQFAEAADKLYGALATKRLKLLDGSIAKVSETSGPGRRGGEGRALREWAHWGWRAHSCGRAITTLWTNGDEAKWLGWMDIAARERADLSQLNAFRERDRRLAALRCRAAGHGRIEPGRGGAERELRPARGLAAHACARFHRSRSDPHRGGDHRAAGDDIHRRLEIRIDAGAQHPQGLFLAARRGRARAPTRPASSSSPSPIPARRLQAKAKDEHFAHIFLGDPEIGGRYSVLSKFGLVPGAAMGLDLERFLDETERMVKSCGAAGAAGRQSGRAARHRAGHAGHQMRARQDHDLCLRRSEDRWGHGWNS